MRALASSDSRAARATLAASSPSCARRSASRGRLALSAGAFEFGRQFARLLLEAPVRLDGALALRRGRLERGVERGHRVEHRVHVRARALDVLFHGLDGLLRAGVLLGGVRRAGGGFVARRLGFGGGLPAPVERQALRFAPRLELLALEVQFVGARLQHLGLLRVERDLLLRGG